MHYIFINTMTKKKKTSSKKTNKSKIKTNRQILEEIIRVDHAGEYGATKIYDGQIAIFGKDSKIGKTIQHMADQEQEHIDKFNDLIIEHKVRPTALLPVWNIAGFALGASTALIGEKAAMACTVAVEKVIGEHYQEQLELLEDDHKELKKTISKFRDDELEHHDIGIEHDAENAPGYRIMTKFIELGCKTAIAISKKV
jgi:ubiquinone biosynthesis monooxygenase Coq7